MIAGFLHQEVDFGNGPVGPANSGDEALFIASFDAAGNRRFAYSLTTSGHFRNNGFSAHMDAVGNVVVTGVAVHDGFGDYLRYPCGSKYVWGDPDGAVAFAARVDTSGQCVWDMAFDWTSGDGLTATAVDDGSAYLSGVNPKGDAGGLFTTKLDADGTSIWWVEGTAGQAIEVDESGGVFLLGTLGQTQPCIVRLDPFGAVTWSKCLGVAWSSNWNGSRITRLSVNPSGAYAIAGHFDGTLSFGTQELDANGTPAMFVGAFDSTNEHVLSKVIAEALSDSGSTNPALVLPALAADGHLALVGGFWRTVDFGGGPIHAIGTGDDDTDAFVAVYDTSGTLTAQATYGGAGADSIQGARYDASGGLLVAGRFSAEVDLGDGPHTTSGADATSSDTWLFVGRLLP